jgi:hypothetical protein
VAEFEYAFLAITRVRVEFVALADGTEINLGPAGPEPALREYFEQRIVPVLHQEYEESLRSWRASLEQFRAAVTVDRRSVKTGVFGQREERVELHFPDGRALELYPEEADEEIARRFVTEHRKPSSSTLTFEEWAERAAPTSRWRTEWRATYFADGMSRDLTVEADEWIYGAPLEAILNILNALGAAGWKLMTVTEDKGVYSGVESANSAAPVRLRYTFMRSRA